MWLKILKLELEKNKDKNFRSRSAILWVYTEDTTAYAIYLNKPKYMSYEEFDDILDKLEIKIKDDMLK